MRLKCYNVLRPLFALQPHMIYMTSGRLSVSPLKPFKFVIAIWYTKAFLVMLDELVPSTFRRQWEQSVVKASHFTVPRISFVSRISNRNIPQDLIRHDIIASKLLRRIHPISFCPVSFWWGAMQYTLSWADSFQSRRFPDFCGLTKMLGICSYTPIHCRGTLGKSS